MQNETLSRDIVALGTPALHNRSGQLGHVCEVKATSGTFTIGGGGLVSDRAQIVIVWEDRTITEIPDSIALPWIEEARAMGFPVINDAPERLQEAREKRAEGQRAAMAEREAAAVARRAFIDDAAGKIPAWAKAVIVAELVEDQSDSMTDYFGSTTKRTVILAFSRHTRDLFPEMRKAAGNFAETAHLVDAPESAEHREKWSMGGGYYLKAGYRHSSGWRVAKRRLYEGRESAESLPFPAEWCLAAPEPETAPTAAHEAGIAGIRIEEHAHTKKGFQMFICIMPERVDREEFVRLRDLAQALGGWYSKPWGKTPGGFAFKDRRAAETFANPSSPTPDDDGPKGERPPTIAAPASDLPDRLRTMADNLQPEIARKLGDRLTNTPKRQREAGNARNDGRRLQRTQQALRALAAAHDAGNVPAELASVRTKSAVFDLMGTVIEYGGGYYDAGRDTGKPSKDSPAARALWAMIDGPSDDERKAEELRRKVEALQFAKIPGYFPTPAVVADRMIDLADLPNSPFDLLEPEAGSGAILDRVNVATIMARVTAYERHASLREVLKLKGYELAGADFMEAEAAPRFDRILMNPPFENGQDIEHVRHAFAMLRDGGRLVAVMSPGPFFRQDRKAQEFRAWFDERGGEKYDLPAGSFKESGTGTAAVLVVLAGDEFATVEPETKPARVRHRVGTCHFASIADAAAYYRPYGETVETVREKIAAGEICIGAPSTCEADERVTLDRSEGRYFIEILEVAR